MKKAEPSAACPECGAPHRLTRRNFGRRVVCRRCGAAFNPLPPSAQAPTSISGPQAEEGLDRLGRRWLDLRPGQIVAGGGEVLSLLGRGGLSRVYRVRRRDWGLDMALKIPQACAVDRLAAEVFLAEAEAWLRPARHPHLVTCHYIINLMGRPAIFMEYVDGPNLSELIGEGRGPLYQGGPALAALTIVDLMIQAARGLDYAHSLDLMNLDVKPANLLTTQGGRLLIGDYAPLAAAAPAESPALRSFDNDSATAISPTRLLGTHQYFSPESATGGPSVSSDLWALALSGLESFLGRRPWEAGSMVGEALAAYLQEPAAVPVPAPMADFFRRALNPDPAHRWPSASEMAAALMAIYEQLDGPYPRPKPQALAETADRLNNKAVSFHELNRPQQAARLWAEARRLDPNHRPTAFNLIISRFGSSITSSTAPGTPLRLAKISSSTISQPLYQKGAHQCLTPPTSSNPGP